MENSNSSANKGKGGTLIAVGGLLISLFGNYLQYEKNKSDAAAGQQQIVVAQQQAETAKDELALKRTQAEEELRRQNRKAQNCDQMLAERNDALDAVHKYDNAITKHQMELQIDKQQLAMAETKHDEFGIARYRSLAQMEDDGIRSLAQSRDQASARVREIEQNCK